MSVIVDFAPSLDTFHKALHLNDENSVRGYSTVIQLLCSSPIQLPSSRSMDRIIPLEGWLNTWIVGAHQKGWLNT
jgi:hypothetical protein